MWSSFSINYITVNFFFYRMWESKRSLTIQSVNLKMDKVLVNVWSFCWKISVIVMEESSKDEHNMDLRPRTSRNYNESDTLLAVSSFFTEPVHTNSSATSTISMTSSSQIAFRAVTTLVSATTVSTASDFVAVATSLFSSLSLTDLQRQVQIAREELKRQ